MNTKKFGLLILLIMVSLFLVIILIKPFNKKTNIPNENFHLRFASVPAIVEAPSHIAYNKGFFLDEGLDIQMEINPDGRTSLNHLFEDKVDIAAVMGTPLIYDSFKRDDFYIIGKIDHNKIHSVISRNDTGITSTQSLKGKKVAVMPGTSGHYFMDSWLILNRMLSSDLEVIPMNGSEAVEAIVNKTVDAMFYWYPYYEIARSKLGNTAMELPSDNILSGSWLIIAKKKFVEENPEVLKKFLRALMTAISYIEENKEESLNIYSEVSGVNKDLSSSIFSSMYYELTLDHALLVDLESQARWLIDSNYVENEEIPNYLDLIYSDLLEEVNPASVMILGRNVNDQ